MYGSQIVFNLQREMRANNNIATGKAINSLGHLIEHAGPQVALTIVGEEYIKKIDEGRKAGKRRPSTSAIEKWINAKQGFRLRDYRGRFVPKTKSNIKSAAFNIARAIGKNGTKPYNLLEYAFKPVEKKIVADVVVAFVEEELNKIIKTKGKL
jgi:hypothetical protein